MKLYAGIDLHSNNSVVSGIDETDRIHTTGSQQSPTKTKRPATATNQREAGKPGKVLAPATRRTLASFAIACSAP
ncbi:hypothetical protein [Marinobacterium sedimentorum]|uniref:hypothetical protein n=1 Tax=Marinobacterium sedimentorum TaxID=2927804 RepID=UPI0020C5F1B9|nr:hypothetical protein [Marinobacterium sedimentorum]MCP8686531.1 hypothetical protein [Marinobacterium sedimentorum]